MWGHGMCANSYVGKSGHGGTSRKQCTQTEKRRTRTLHTGTLGRTLAAHARSSSRGLAWDRRAGPAGAALESGGFAGPARCPRTRFLPPDGFLRKVLLLDVVRLLGRGVETPPAAVRKPGEEASNKHTEDRRAHCDDRDILHPHASGRRATNCSLA